MLVFLLSSAHAETPELPDRFALGLSGSVGGSSNGFETSGALRFRFGRAFQLEPWLRVETSDGTTTVEDGDPVAVGEPRLLFGGDVRVPITTLHGAELAVLAGGSWERRTSFSIYRGDDYRRTTTSVDTEASILAGLGVERAVTPWLSVGGDVHTSVYRWTTEVETEVMELLTEDVEAEEQIETTKTHGVPFSPAVRLVATIWL